MNNGATLSDCRKYRYLLWRIWDDSKPLAHFCMLNPSTADESITDPTLTRCIRFGKSWNMGGVLLTNLFPYRATKANKLLTEVYRSGPDGENHRYVAEAASRAAITVVGWGNHANRRALKHAVKPLYENVLKQHNPQCFVITQAGQPQHPLYVSYETPLQPWSIA